MSQTLCSRCHEPLAPKQRHIGKILCDACEHAWRRDFDSRWQGNHLDRTEHHANRRIEEINGKSLPSRE